MREHYPSRGTTINYYVLKKDIMKTRTTLSISCLLGFSVICQAQIEQENSKTDTVQPMNLLDAQTKMYGQIFDLGGAGEDNPLGGATNYAELIEKMDAPEEQKERLREQYKLYDLSLDSKKKDSLKPNIDQSLMGATEKSPPQNE